MLGTVNSLAFGTKNRSAGAKTSALLKRQKPFPSEAAEESDGWSRFVDSESGRQRSLPVSVLSFSVYVPGQNKLVIQLSAAAIIGVSF